MEENDRNALRGSGIVPDPRYPKSHSEAPCPQVCISVSGKRLQLSAPCSLGIRWRPSTEMRQNTTDKESGQLTNRKTTEDLPTAASPTEEGHRQYLAHTGPQAAALEST